MKVERLSPSQESTLANCGQQYAFRYVEKRRVAPGFAMFRGRAVHSGVETNMLHKMQTGEVMPVADVKDAARAALDTEISSGEAVLDGDYQGMSLKDAKGVLTDEVVGLSGLHAEELAPIIQPTAIEVRVEMAPSELMPFQYVGVLDLIDGSTKIRDTKTKRASPPKTQAAKSPQLSSYAMLFLAKYGKLPSELDLDVLIRTPGRGEVKKVIQPTTRDSEDVQIAIRRSQRAAEVIESERFLPASPDSWICDVKWCGYAREGICPYFRKSERPTT